MRPLRLDLDGFAVFREPTTVDFTDTDFFALVGPTGSGKSTVLDAICFALYGTVPRWGDRRGVSNALAPSSAEARVRLVFESGGGRYVVTRVVRRDGKGGVTTRSAGMEVLPTGFDLSAFDGGLTSEDLGTVLAGTPAELDVAVQAVIGLPYEQFIKCVVLPQGEFAAFLHAKPAERQKILVNLLGLDVYGRIREKATGIATTADAQLGVIDRQLAGMADADDAALAAAVARVAALRSLGAEVDRIVPRLAAAQSRATVAAEALAGLDAQIQRLGAVSTPADSTTVAARAAEARTAVAGAAATVATAEEIEEKLRGEVSSAGDATALRRLLDTHTERDRLAVEAQALQDGVAEAETEHTRATQNLERAKADAAAATEALEAAREDYQTALNGDRAAALRPHLTDGGTCPVCTQPVTPAVLRAIAVVDAPAGHRSLAAAAEAAGKEARKRVDTAAKTVEDRDRTARGLDRTLAASRAHAEQVLARLADLDGRLDGAPAPDALRRDLAALARVHQELEGAAGAVKAAREAHRRAATNAERAEDRLRLAWRAFDTARDAVAPFAPPPADRDDLAAAWRALTGWAGEQVEQRRADRRAAQDAVGAADAAVAEVRAAVIAAFAAADLPAPGEDPARAAVVALERAEAAQRRVEERQAEAAQLRAQKDTAARESQVAKTLAQHLRADRFERWLLAEALDSLVDGASTTLRELTGGQYDLGHDKGEFFVVDHHDAGLRRPVRTLSGGETFQASLALALALSEQLAGVSTAAASLESIMLDEGFGTLDSSTLETVATTLENLAARGDRMVGVVTHVGLLAERIPVRFEVRRDARTAYVERIDR